MSYNGRTVMGEVARKHKWVELNITADGHTGRKLPGIEFVLYRSALGGTDDLIVIAWTPENTAAHVEINGKTITGMGALITVREFIEGK